MSVTFKGSHGVLVTPFTESGRSVDVDALRRLLDWQLECGAPGVIMLGTTGEFLTVDSEERDTIVRTTVEHVNGRMAVWVGAMNAYTPIAVENSRRAQDLGADGLMILPPYYYTPTEDEMVRYYAAICAAVDLPIMLYNNPFTSNVDMSAAFVARLGREFAQVQYIKEASQDLGRISDILRLSEGAVQVFAGERVVDSFLLGAIGYVNPYANYIPYASTHIFDYLESGRIAEARSIEALISSIDHVIAEGHPTYGHQCYSKALAAATGHPVGDVRPPLTTFAQLGDEGVQRVARITSLMRDLDALMERLES